MAKQRFLRRGLHEGGRDGSVDGHGVDVQNQGDSVRASVSELPCLDTRRGTLLELMEQLCKEKALVHSVPGRQKFGRERAAGNVPLPLAHPLQEVTRSTLGERLVVLAGGKEEQSATQGVPRLSFAFESCV